jgi:membrane protein YdbS with pleckstrin-like domain
LGGGRLVGRQLPPVEAAVSLSLLPLTSKDGRCCFWFYFHFWFWFYSFLFLVFLFLVFLVFLNTINVKHHETEYENT